MTGLGRMLTTWCSELGAAARAAAALPRGLVEQDAPFDPTVPLPTPVVFVHGLLGHPTNFLALRRALAPLGVANFASFGYGPRLDYQRLAGGLGEEIEALCARTGAAEVDVVGHSLGGLAGRYLVEIGDGRRVRRLVTLGAPWYSRRLPAQELALFAAEDQLIPQPSMLGPAGRVVVVPRCGHLGLLYHPVAVSAVARFLCRPRLRELRVAA